MANFNSELKEYNCFPRKLIFDNNLSTQARFLYCYMAAKPEGWSFLIAPMLKELGYSRNTFYKYLDELISSGWIVRVEQIRSNGKFSSTSYILKAVNETPCPKNEDTEHRVPISPCTKNTDTENLVHIDKRESIDKRDNKNIYKENKESSIFVLFRDFCAKYRKYGGRTRGAQTELDNLKKKHRDWESIIPLLDHALEKETRVREEALRLNKFFPPMKNLQTYINQRSWEMYVDVEDYTADEYHPHGYDIRYMDDKDYYLFIGNFPTAFMDDGYDDDKRPDGATLVLNNMRGKIIWSAEERIWRLNK